MGGMDLASALVLRAQHPLAAVTARGHLSRVRSHLLATSTEKGACRQQPTCDRGEVERSEGEGRRAAPSLRAQRSNPEQTLRSSRICPWIASSLALLAMTLPLTVGKD